MIKVAVTVIDTGNEDEALLVHLGNGFRSTLKKDEMISFVVKPKHGIMLEETSTAAPDPSAVVLSDGINIKDGGC
jgi:hypothetical protein